MSAQAAEDIRHDRIGSLSGIKIVALAAIFIWHLGFLKSPDIGSRMCELFFACSAVLEAIRHYGTYCYAPRSLAHGLAQKLKRIYPLYLATFAFGAWLGQIGASPWSLAADPTEAILAVFMLQVWNAKSAYAFVGAAWFVCDLMLCYAFVPFMSLAVQHMKAGSGNRWWPIAVMLAVCILLRLACDLLCGYGILAVSPHTFPPIRVLDYFCAYLFGCLALAWHERRRPGYHLHGAVQTLIEVAAVALYVLQVMYTTPYIFARTLGILCAAMLVLVFVFCRGGVSFILGAPPFRWLAAIELEFFLFHQPCIQLAYFLLPDADWPTVAGQALAFAAVLVFLAKLIELAAARLGSKHAR